MKPRVRVPAQTRKNNHLQANKAISDTIKSLNLKNKKSALSNSFPTSHYSPEHEASQDLRAFPTWKPRFKTPRELYPAYSRRQLMARASDVVKNHPSAANALRVSRNGVIGDGWTLSLNPVADVLGISEVEAERWANKVETLFNTYAKSHDNVFDPARKLNFNQMLGVAYNSMFVLGETIACVRYKKSISSPFGTCASIFHPSRLETPAAYESHADVIDGIRIDKFGEAIEYYLKKPDFNQGVGGNANDFVQVPASIKKINRKIAMHLYRPTLPEEMRGATDLSSGIVLLKQISEYMSNTNEARAMQNAIALILKSNEDIETVYKVMGINPNTTNPREGINKYAEGLAELHSSKFGHYDNISDQYAINSDSGARFVTLMPGEDLSCLDISPNNDTVENFMKVSQKLFTAGVGTDYATTNQDYSDTSFSASRLSLGQIFQHYRQQKEVIKNGFAMPLVQCFVQEALSIGIIDLPSGVNNFNLAAPFLLAGDFVSNSRPEIDPLKDAKADIARRDAGLVTEKELASARGVDWMKIKKQRNIEKKFSQSLESGASI